MVDVDAKSTLEFAYPRITQEQRAGNTVKSLTELYAKAKFGCRTM